MMDKFIKSLVVLIVSAPLILVVYLGRAELTFGTYNSKIDKELPFGVEDTDVTNCGASIRQKLVSRICRRMKESSHGMVKTKPRLLVDDDRKILYCPIPKVMSRTMRRMLLQNRSDVDQARLDEKPWTVHYQNFNEITITSEDRMEKFQNYTKLLIVRNPLSRLYSAYINKFVATMPRYNTREKFTELIQFLFPDARVVDGKEFITFEQFAHMIILQRNDTEVKNLENFPYISNVHWRSQVTLCDPCLIEYDYILKIETMEHDTDHILKLFNVNNIPKLNSGTTGDPNSNIFNHTVLGVTDAYREMSMEIREKVKKFYATDLELFGYDIDQNTVPSCNYPGANCC